MKLKPVRNTELYVTIIHQPVTVSSKHAHAAEHMHVQMKHCLAHLQDLIPGVVTYVFYTSQSRD